MQLSPPRTPPLREARKTFRTSPGALSFALGVTILLAGISARFFLLGFRGGSAVVQIVAAPVGLGAILAYGFGFLYLGGALRKSFRATNWILAIARDGVYLNLRSFLNADFEGQDATVVFLAFGEVATAGRVRESYRVRRGEETLHESRFWLELVLSGVDTAPLAEALRVECAKIPPQRSFLGVKTRTKANDRPVLLPSPGVVRVQWRRGMLRALEEHVRIVSPRRVDLSVEAGGTPEERCLAVLRRGDTIGAVRVLQTDRGMGLSEARRRVDEIERTSA